MPGEKTEQATPKKRKDSRKEGEVVKSKELVNCLTLGAACLSLNLLWNNMMDSTKDAFRLYLGEANQIYTTIDTNIFRNILVDVLGTLFIIVAPLMTIVMITGILANYLQVGFLFTPKVLMVKGSRIDPIKGFKRVVSKQALMEFLKSVAKMSFIALIAFLAIRDVLKDIIILIEKSIDEAILYGLDLAMSISFKILIGLSVVAVADYIFQWFSHDKKIKMTKQEVKDENKNMEGDPQIQQKIKAKQKEIASSRMMQDVAEADAVVTNPTHFAVAIKYDLKKAPAPIVVAKGQDYVAKRIKDKALENNVEIVENKEVARTLYNSTEIGQQIPYDMFKAVAEILSYVYRLKGKELE